MRVDKIEARYHIFSQLLAGESPALAAHMEAVGFTPALVVTDWWLTLFSRHFAPDIVGRLWDWFLLEV